MLIGLNGLINSGKGTVANYLVKNRGFIKLSFASALKDVVAKLFNFPRNLLEGDTEESRIFRETPDKFWSKNLSNLGVSITPRYCLQYIGTEIVRNNLCQDFWVHRLKNEIDQYKETVDIVVDDVRFVNEAQMISDNGGKIFGVIRGEPPEWWGKAIAQNAKTSGYKNAMELYHPEIHISEWASADRKFIDLITDDIKNNSTQEELFKNIENIIFKNEGKQ